VAEYLISTTTTQTSRIVVADGSGRDLPALLPARAHRTTAAVFSQPSVARLAADIAEDLRTIGLAVHVKELPDRDDAKDMGVIESCLAWLNEHRLTRHDIVVGVGGGALTDVTGFVAALYLRGVEAAYVPTTLLGAVDAAIGGKTGVNVGGKNLAGAFHLPVLVVVDPDILALLPEHLMREGAAEALKTGLIGDERIVRLYEEYGLSAPLGEVVERSIAVKAAVVAEDFIEEGPRALLNYGHTIGHAVESASGMPHGNAVAIGMIAAGAASRAVTGFDGEERQRAVIERLGLPTDAGGLERAGVMPLVALDKKRDAGGVRMVLLDRIGSAVVSTVDDATVSLALDAVGIR